MKNGILHQDIYKINKNKNIFNNLKRYVMSSEWFSEFYL